MSLYKRVKHRLLRSKLPAETHVLVDINIIWNWLLADDLIDQFAENLFKLIGLTQVIYLIIKLKAHDSSIQVTRLGNSYSVNITHYQVPTQRPLSPHLHLFRSDYHH